MNKLLYANFSRLFHSFLFWLGMLCSAGISIFIFMMRYIDSKQYAEVYAQMQSDVNTVDELSFSMGLILIFIIAVVVALFVGTEYSDGTIRNKIISGHKKTDIYLANLITCVSADTILFLTNIAVSYGFGSLLFGRPSLSLKQTLTSLLLTVAAETALSALLLMFSMLIHKKSIGSITALMATMLLLMATMTVTNRLSEPEYYDAYTYTNDVTGEEIHVDSQKNPHFLRGAKRKLYEFWYDFIPICQLYRLMQPDFGQIHVILLYDGVIFLCTSAAGVMIFRRKNLN